MIVEPVEPSETTETSSDHSGRVLPAQVQQHLGVLLAGVYAAENAESEANRFAELLAKLDTVLGQAQTRRDTEFRQLLLTAMPALRRFAVSLAHQPAAADDLMQDTMLRVWKNRARFELGTNFEAWTFTIMRNQFYTTHRKHREVQDSDGAHAERLVSLPEQAGRLDLHDIQAAMAQLEPLKREALILVAVEGLSYEEAATIMDCQIGTVKSRVWRARNQLVSLLGFDGGGVGNDAVMLSALTGPSKVSG